MRRAAVVLAVVVLPMALTACDSDRRAISRDDLPDIPAEPAARVEIDEAGFEPGDLEIHLGETVEFVNDGDDEHGIRTDDSAIDTGVLLPGESVVISFGSVGDHHLTDLADDTHAMTVTVGPPSDDEG